MRMEFAFALKAFILQQMAPANQFHLL